MLGQRQEAPVWLFSLGFSVAVMVPISGEGDGHGVQKTSSEVTECSRSPQDFAHGPTSDSSPFSAQGLLTGGSSPAPP